MIVIKNIRIEDLLKVLMRLNLNYNAVNLQLDDKENRIVIEPIDNRQSIENKSFKITEDNIDDLIT